MSKEELRPFEKEFIDKTTGVLAKYKSIKDDEAYTYDPEHIDGVELINFCSVGDHMVETTEMLNLIIAPIWAKNEVKSGHAAERRDRLFFMLL